MTRTLLAALAALTLGLVQPAVAQMPHGGPIGGDFSAGPGPGLFGPLLFRPGDLTPEQDTRVRRIMTNERATMEGLFRQLDAANNELAQKLLANGKLSAEDLAPQMQRLQQLRQQLSEQGLKTALALRAVLTPEQLDRARQRNEKLQKLHEEMRQLMDER